MNAAVNPVPRIEQVPSSQRYEAICARAQQLYEQRGRIAGHELEDWLQAEAEIDRERLAAEKPVSPCVVVKVNGVTYTGEYDRSDSGGYQAGEWNAGDPMPVRVEGDKMYIRRKNGTELETRIVKRVG